MPGIVVVVVVVAVLVRRLFPLSCLLSLSPSSPHVAQRVPQDPVTPLARERFWRGGGGEEGEGGGGAVIQPDKRS